MGLTEQEIAQILKLVEQSDFGELRLESGDLKLVVRKKGYVAPEAERETPPPGRCAAQAPADAPSIPPATARRGSPGAGSVTGVPSDVLPVPSPLLGTFYRRPSPDAPPYVEVGTFIRADDTVCTIEVMKVFTAVKAGVSGYVTDILAENGALVEYGQPLFLVRPETDTQTKAA